MALRFLTAGESHGRALVGILEGMPAGLALTAPYIGAQMARRKLGHGRGPRQKIETDEVRILSGVRRGFTLGSPIALLIENRDFEDWKDIMRTDPARGEAARRVDVPRPGHADLGGGLKYRYRDLRNVLERASARETAMRVALGSVARRLLEGAGAAVGSRVARIGAVADDTPAGDVRTLNARADRSPVRSLGRTREMAAFIDGARAAGDTVGGVIEVLAGNVPTGLGSHVHWDRRLEGPIAAAFMSLNGVKGVEIGLGFGAAMKPGSQVHDQYAPGTGGRVRHLSNRSGGIDGGISTGQDIVVRAAMKPLATLAHPLHSVDLRTRKNARAHVERSDVCAVPSAAVIGESLLALVLAEALLEKFGGDSMQELLPRVELWRRTGTSI